MEKVRLKGGSLSGTFLMTGKTGEKFVRKEVSLYRNREYGFQRWYSQLKRIQRYSRLVPGTFPELLSYGINKNKAFFDMEYIQDSMTAHDFLLQETSEEKIQIFFNELLSVMQSLHSNTIVSFETPIQLYIYEEVERKIVTIQRLPQA